MDDRVQNTEIYKSEYIYNYHFKTHIGNEYFFNKSLFEHMVKLEF